MVMIALTDIGWTLIGVLALLNLVSALRISIYMHRMGRPALRWFFITLVFTAIPYTVYALCHNFGGLLRGEPGPGPHAPPARCPHCRTILPLDEDRPAELPATCPRCGAPQEGSAHA